MVIKKINSGGKINDDKSNRHFGNAANTIGKRY